MVSCISVAGRYKVQDSIIYQDNQSAILLEKNGKASSGKRTRHINIRYFFVQDRVAAGEVSVKYCPTGEMIADFFTKPLQGTLFKKFRDQIMNNNPAADSPQDCRSVLEESDARDQKYEENDLEPGTDEGWTLVQRKSKKKVKSKSIRAKQKLTLF